MPKKEKKQKAEKSENEHKGLAILFIVIIIFAVAGALIYGLSSVAGTNINTFENNFNSASRVAIVAMANNGTALSATVGCASNLIEQIVGTHGTAHKNATVIDYYVLNQTGCAYLPNGLGQATTNFSRATPQQCINMTKSEPTIFINYSDVNSTVIKPMALYVTGNSRYLLECGVASEITSQ